MELRTLEDWNKKGFRIKKGERSRQRDLQNRPLFTSDQVWDTTKIRQSFNSREEEDMESMAWGDYDQEGAFDAIWGD